MAQDTPFNSDSAQFVPPHVPRFAFLALLGGNAALAFGPLLVRLADTGPVAAGFWRLLIGLPLLFLLARSKGQHFSGLPRWIWWTILLGGLLFAGDLASWHLGIVQTKLANATLFGNASSLLLPIVGMIAARALPRPMQMLAFGIACVGALLLMGNSYELAPENLRGDLLCILAGVLYTGYLLSIQRARGSLGSWGVLALSTAASVPPMLVFAWLLGEQIMPQNWTPLVVLALSSQIIGQGLIVYAIAYFSPLVIGLVLLIQPVIAAVIGWFAFQEGLTPTDAVGAALVALALVLIRLPEKAPRA